MADAKPSKMHGDDSHDSIPTKSELPPMPATIRLLDVSGKAVKLVGEYQVGDVDAKGNKTIRRDYA